MSQQRGFFPEGLDSQAREILERLSRNVDCENPGHYLEAARQHLQHAMKEASRQPTVNVQLARAIVAVFETLISDWPSIPGTAKPWLIGAMRYFPDPNDVEPDFTSFLGFEDDVEVLNACLRLAEREDLCINPVDYD